MGQVDAASESGGGRGTVKIGKYEVAEIGGWMRLREDFRADLRVGESGSCFFFSFSSASFFLSDGRTIPFVTGAGRSRTSVALRASWREKSLACHHSRNFRAKIDAGRKYRRDVRS